MRLPVGGVCPRGAVLRPTRGTRSSSSHDLPTSLLVSDESPIGKKWIKLGGAPVIGNPISDVAEGPNATLYRRYEKGVIVYSEDWGAVYLSSFIFDNWLSLAGRTNSAGQDMLGYVGVPSGDSVSTATSETGFFERGLLVARPAAGTALLVEGPIYLHYLEVASTLGSPTADEEPVPGGRRQAFEHGDIYWKSGGKAVAVQGAIRQRWLDLGGVSGPLGYPLTDEAPVLNGPMPARTALFENGSIFASDATGAWELTGPIYDAYVNQFGGPSGWLGLPISGHGTTPTSGGYFNDFQNGVIVYHPGGSYGGIHAFNKLQLHVQRIAGYGGDCVCVPVVGCACGGQDVYAYIKATTPSGVVVNVRRPPSGDGGEDFEINESWDVAEPVHSDLTVHVRVQAWDGDDTSDDDLLGTVDVDYSIDNLWGLFEPTEHSQSNGGDSFKVWFGLKGTYPFEVTDFPRQAFWSFLNFTTDTLTYGQYAATFQDVSPVEYWYYHPWNALFYEIAYKGIASGGYCFGMALESVYAEKGRSLYAEPVFQYFPDTQSGARLQGSTLRTRTSSTRSTSSRATSWARARSCTSWMCSCAARRTILSACSSTAARRRWPGTRPRSR
jgi:hypothetical protein